MIYKVFSVYDLKACCYSQPFFSGTPGSAMRAFGDEVAKPGSALNLHPGDYQLHEVGTWDDKSAELTSNVPVKFLCSASDFVANHIPPVQTGKTVAEMQVAYEGAK